MEMNTITTPTALCFGPQAAADPLYVDYHDTEWGRPVLNDIDLFERVCLEIFQVGLSWRTVLYKRDAFRNSFADFDSEVVARFSECDIERLLGDARIIRNRAKINACITGARAVQAMHEAGELLDDLIWQFRPITHQRPESASKPAATPESFALAKELRSRGFKFVGPVNMYATLQACGVVNDHVVGCPIGDAIDYELPYGFNKW